MRFFTTMLLLACIPGYAFAALHSSADIRISGSPDLRKAGTTTALQSKQ